MRPRVLVIEDNELNLELITQLLEDDYEIDSRTDGRAGLEAVKELRPDVVVLDLSLPVMDGWEVARRIRSDESIAGTPIVVLTAHAMPGDEEKALEAGCDAYLTKPLDETALFSALERLLPR